MTVLGTAEGV
jgi:hypothetical protein